MKKNQSESKESKAGGRRAGAGRPKGRKSKSTLEIEAAAKLFAADALGALKWVAANGKNESARVSAAVAILERGYGKAKQQIQHGGLDGGPIHVVFANE